MRSDFDRYAAKTLGWKPLMARLDDNYRWKTPDGMEHWFRVEAFGSPNERVVYSSLRAERECAEAMAKFMELSS